MRFVFAAALLALTFTRLDAQNGAPTYGRSRSDPLIGIINQVPSFSGMWLDKEGNFHGSLTDLNDSTRLRPLLAEFIGDSRRAFLLKPGKGIVIERAKYSYAKLYEWQCAIERLMGSVDGFQSIGVRERENQVHIGVIKPAVIDKVRQIVKSLKIPDDAVHIEVEGQVYAL